MLFGDSSAGVGVGVGLGAVPEAWKRDKLPVAVWFAIVFPTMRQ